MRSLLQLPLSRLVTPKDIKDDEILASVQSVKALVEGLPAPAAQIPGKDDEILSSIASVESLVKALPALVVLKDIKDKEILASIASVSTLIKAIPTTSLADKSKEIITEIKSVKSVAKETKKKAAALTTIIRSSLDKEILSEAKIIKGLVAKQKSAVLVTNVRTNDKGAPIKENGNSVKVNAVEIESKA
ncbi:hypothetical protein BKA61DRAFT_714431 [Leptodontidium sp. MPI-SDFR-AT-0119]|nr:hypothetical protein BKA61DRAFT_714431 [Leptodontidium sp. MPI-SDFR-AT-0119]